MAALAIGSPALADHMGPTGVGTGGGALNVIGADVLEQGRGGAGFRLTYVRPDQRSDEELADLAGEHIHAHNTDYNLVAAAGVAYGVTDRLTLTLELPYVRRDDLREGAHAHTPGGTVNEVEELGSVAGIGDAPGDYNAAKANNALFYPINPGAEEASWKRFHDEGIDRFLSGKFAGEYQQKLLAEFDSYLPATPAWERK